MYFSVPQKLINQKKEAEEKKRKARIKNMPPSPFTVIQSIYISLSVIDGCVTSLRDKNL